MDIRKITAIAIMAFMIIMPATYAGIGISEGSVSINAGESVELCNILIYSTIPDTTLHTVGYGNDIEKYVSSITPNSFPLQEIDCPTEGNARRACIKELCAEGQSDYCRVVCTTFTGPMEFSFDPQTVKVNSGVRDSIRAGAAVISEVTPFVIYYTPFDAKVAIGAVMILGAAGLTVWNRMRNKVAGSRRRSRRR